MLRAASVSYTQTTRTIVKMPFNLPPQTASSSSSSSTSSSSEEYYFALAEVKGEIHLVQISSSTPPSALTLIDIKMFKHELATIFRHSQTTTMHPRDVRVIEQIGDNSVRYEEDSGTVFLAREIVGRMRKMSVAAKGAQTWTSMSEGNASARTPRRRYAGNPAATATASVFSTQYAHAQLKRQLRYGSETFR